MANEMPMNFTLTLIADIEDLSALRKNTNSALEVLPDNKKINIKKRFNDFSRAKVKRLQGL